MTSPVFFRPAEGWVGDVIPYVHEGEFWLFYLHERRESPHTGMAWNLVTTRDLVHFVDHGTALPNGTVSDADFNAYTGSVVRDHDGVHHLFYTGQNPERLGSDGRPLQLVMHATSTDGMRTWAKHPEETFGAPVGYEPGDWRDPFVFWDAPARLWRMLIASRHDTGPARRRGVIAQCVSSNLEQWSPAEPFWDPHRYITHECPEVFSWGDWWYLVYSEFSDAFTTRYRVASSPDGPWTVPERDTIDGRAFYAAKSAERDGRRFFFGWIATREHGDDDGAWEWAGTMSILEAHQRPDGSLGFSPPRELLESFQERLTLDFDAGQLPTRLGQADGYQALVSRTAIPEQCRIRIELDVEAGTSECGLLLRANDDGDRAHIVRLEPKRQRMVIDRWPRRQTGSEQWQISGDVPHMIELERPCDLRPGCHVLEVVFDRDLCVITIDQDVSLSTRLQSRWGDRLGLFAGEGHAVIRRCDVSVRDNPSSATRADALAASAGTD